MVNKNIAIRISLLIIGIILIISLLKLGIINQKQKNDIIKNIPFQTLNQGYYNNIIEKQTRIIKSSEEWADFWTEMFPTQMIASAINFDKSMVIAVLQGQKPTGGYAIEIEKITEYPNYIEIIIKETSPGDNCITTQALTSPFHIIEMERSKKEIKFTFKQETSLCQ